MVCGRAYYLMIHGNQEEMGNDTSNISAFSDANMMAKSRIVIFMQSTGLFSSMVILLEPGLSYFMIFLCSESRWRHSADVNSEC